MTFRLKAASGPMTGRTFELGENTAIGSGEEADIRIEGLLERHARIVYDDETLTLEAVDQAWVNGDPARSQALTSGDEIRLGGSRFVLQAPGLRPPSVLRDKPARRFNPWVWVAIGVALIGALALAAYYLPGYF